jgi:RNA polymerase sigma-70 factor (ECF subfamily)
MNDTLQHLISQGNRKAFDRFYHFYYEQVFRFAFYFLKDKGACSEVLTNVFLSIWKSWDKVTDVTNIETYLYVATRNEANRYLKNNIRHQHVSIDEIPLQFDVSNDPSPENQLLTKEMEALLNRVVAELPEKSRLVFLMVRQEGLKPKEIAEILSISEITVRVQLKNATDKIVEKLKPIIDGQIYPRITRMNTN